MSSSTNTTPGVKGRLLKAGTELFAEQGYEAASIREICQRAKTSSNMIHYYFGDKEGLFTAILETFSSDTFIVPLAIIEQEAVTSDQFKQNFSHFIAATLEALVMHQALFTLVMRENITLDVFADYRARFADFLRNAQQQGLVRPELDPYMLTGLIIDRLGNQVMYADWIKQETKCDIINDTKYQQAWLKANTDLFLHGFLA